MSKTGEYISNLNYFVAVINLIDKEIAMISGINPNEQFEP